MTENSTNNVITSKESTFTKNQLLAINTKNKDILVSAGAGSGKTTVLTKRLIEKIIAGDSVTDFLVVTFMKAAAADVKRKLYEALLAETAKDPTNKHIYRQSLLVGEANICTISAYCLSLVKENFALLGISPRVRVLDETEADMMLRTVVEQLVCEGYDSESEDFLLLSDTFTGDKNDNDLIDKMVDLYNDLRVTLDRYEMLDACAENLLKEAEIIRKNGFFACKTGIEIRERLKCFYDEFIASANDLYDYATTVATEDCYFEQLEKFINGFELIKASLDTNYVNYIETAKIAFKGFTYSKKGAEQEDHEIGTAMRDKIKKAHEKVKSRYIRGDDEYNAQSFEKCARVVLIIKDFLKKIDDRYEAKKLESSVLDYTDFEQKALKLLETKDENGNYVPTELCLKKQSSFKEILVDEYQDVNPMQDRLFALLSGESNRFMVGDVKQSIYRFRNAYPDIFLGYKDAYHPDAEDEMAKNATIFLRENFRCGEAVINYVNHLFDTATLNREYRREYEGEWLVKATKRADMKNPVVIAVADKESGKSKEARASEAEYIAREILRLKNTEKSDDGKAFEFNDFCVMLGAMKGYSIEYEKAFNKYGIPYKTEVSENFLENPDIRLAVSALKAIDDPTDDISLCALMRSPIANFTADELYMIRQNLESSSFWSAVKATSESDTALAKKCTSFIDRISDWRRESLSLACADFVKSFLVSSGLLRISATTDNRVSMLLLYDYANKYTSQENYGLSGFLDYMSELSSGKREIADASKSGESDAVSFITVHKSKGLEFKVCFLANTDKRFRGLNNSNEITLLRGEGIYFRLRDRANFTTYDPLCNINAADREREIGIGEELRKLYVALTRAMERLYITGSAEEGWEDKRYLNTAAKSWLDLVLGSVIDRAEMPFVTLMKINKGEGGGYIPITKKGREIPATQAMLDLLKFEYPYKNSSKTAAKISVSELREGLLEDDEYNRMTLSVPASRVAIKPQFASKKAVGYDEIGTANHLFMQFCDMKSVDQLGVEAEADRLRDIKMISPEQHKMLDISALKAFFASDLYREISESKRVYREKRFSVSDKIGASGDTILVQGVIDCFFENKDGSFTVVDYKTDRVKTGDELIARHKVQLDYYKKAVERMTGKAVSRVLLYSFALNCEVEV